MLGRHPQETSLWLSFFRQRIDPVWTLVLGWDLRGSRRARDELIIAIRNDPAVDPDALRLADMAERLPYPEERKAKRQRWIGMIAASVTGLVTLSSVAYLHYDRTQIDFTTAKGGYEREELPDNSTAELNTETALSVDMHDSQRNVVMRRGEAWFKVAHDQARPFFVTAGNTRVRGMDTAFTVRLLGNQSVEVDVTEGVVELIHQAPRSRVLGVIPWGKRKDPAIQHVSAGHMASAADGRIRVASLSSQQMRERLAWRNGELVFSGQSFAEVVDAFNRYNTLRLEIGDPEIAGIRLGGTFKATDVESYLDGLLADGYSISRVSGGGGEEVARVFRPES